jgi:hypothetical protein
LGLSLISTLNYRELPAAIRRVLVDRSGVTASAVSPLVGLHVAGERLSGCTAASVDMARAAAMKPDALCTKVPISKARSAGCVLKTAYTSPRPAPVSSRIMSSAKSTGCWLRIPRRLYCRVNRQRLTPIRCRVSQRCVRWLDRSFPWWPPPLVLINCSAVRARGQWRSMHWQRGCWSKVSHCRRRPVAPMILPGRAAKSDTNE